MINDIFTDEFLGELEKWTKRLAPLVGLLILAVAMFFFVGQLRGDMRLLQTHSDTNSSKSVTERLAEIRAEQAGTATAAAIAAASTPTTISSNEALADRGGNASGVGDVNAAIPEPAIPEAPTKISELFSRGACTGCHMIPGIPGAVGAIGPDLASIGTVGSQRVEGLDATEYIYESLMDPQAYIAPECPMGECPIGVMLPTFVQALNESEIEQMVSYLVSLR